MATTYYLKCQHCGHLNEVKSQYIIFCESCNKKVNNTYHVWSQTHSNKTFDDYKQQVCITNEQPVIVSSNRKHTSGSVVLNIVLLILLPIAMLLSFCLGVVCSDQVKGLIHQKELSTYADEGSWHRYRCGEFLSVESPIPLKESNLPDGLMTKQSMDLIATKGAITSEISESNSLEIIASCFEYIPNIPLSLEGAVLGALSAQSNRPKITDFESNEQYFSRPDMLTSLHVGSYKENGTPVYFHMLVLMKGQKIAQIGVIHPNNDQNEKKVAERIINSAYLK